MEVTDDKTLPKELRKKIQAETPRRMPITDIAPYHFLSVKRKSIDAVYPLMHVNVEL